MKVNPYYLLIGLSAIVVACESDNRPTISRTVVEGYNECVKEAVKKRFDETSRCDFRYGIGSGMKISDYKVVD